jgi:hypothetical protein
MQFLIVVAPRTPMSKFPEIVQLVSVAEPPMHQIPSPEFPEIVQLD